VAMRGASQCAVAALLLLSIWSISVDCAPVAPASGAVDAEKSGMESAFTPNTEDVSLIQEDSEAGEGTQVFLDESKDAANGKSANSTNSTNAKEKMIRAGKVRAYMKKIKQYQGLKKERWEPETEQKLASQLVDLDDIMKPSKNDREMEAKLRTGPKRLQVELSLRRLHEHKDQRIREKKAVEQKQKQVEKEKADRAKALAMEEKNMAKQIKKYEKTSISKKFRKKLKDAKKEMGNALKQEDTLKKSPLVQQFSKQYGLDKPAEEEHDYPAAAPASPKGTPQVKPAAQPAAKPAAQPAAKPAAQPAAKPAAQPAAKPAALLGDATPPAPESQAMKEVDSVLDQANNWPSSEERGEEHLDEEEEEEEQEEDEEEEEEEE